MNIRPSPLSSHALNLNRFQSGKRRSLRMALKASVALSGQDHQNYPFALPAHASNLNRYGAAVWVNRELALGSTIVVRNKFGAEFSARVVTQVSVAKAGTRAYGVEFVEQNERSSDFWGISFPACEPSASLLRPRTSKDAPN